MSDCVTQLLPCITIAVFHVAGQADEILGQIKFIHDEDQSVDPHHSRFDPPAVCTQVDPFDLIHIICVAYVLINPVPESVVFTIAADIRKVTGIFQMMLFALRRIPLDSLMHVDQLADVFSFYIFSD